MTARNDKVGSLVGSWVDYRLKRVKQKLIGGSLEHVFFPQESISTVYNEDLIGGLEHFYCSIYWEFHHPN